MPCLNRRIFLSLPSLFLTLFLQIFATRAEDAPVIRLNPWDGLRNALSATDPAATRKRCALMNLTQLSGTAFILKTPTLQAGVYELTLPLKLQKINHINTAPLQWTLSVSGAGKGTRAFDILLIERAGVYQPIRCRFNVARPGKAILSLRWKRVALSADLKASVQVKKSKLANINDVRLSGDNEDEDLDELEAEISDEPPISGVKYLWGAIDQLRMTRVADFAIEQLEVNKIRYRPGEKANISMRICNEAKAREVRVVTDLVHELNAVIPVDEQKIKMTAYAQKEINLTSPPMTAKWGYAVRVRVFDGTRLIAEKNEYFTVHDNMWAVAITGKGAAQFTAHITRKNAIAAAKWNKRLYQNWVESGFWAPDEFGDFTPDTERWWGGQGCYYGSISGTKMQIEEGHKVGISYAVYSNIWGGDGPPAFEMIRQHPNWGYASTFDTEWFERWDQNTMGTGKPGRPMHVWPLTIINHSTPAPALHHARELIESHRIFGWDAVRYDSHAISNKNARIMRIVKDAVHAEVPEFRFGYNSSVVHHNPNLTAAFKAHCENGALIMEEGIRQFGGGGMSHKGGATYKNFARRILDFKEEARESGGNFLAIGMDKCFPNDLVYQYIIWLAGNTHPCYNWPGTSVANYRQFATRYAGLIWDLKVKPIKKPEDWVQPGKAADFLWLWKEYVHLRDLGHGKKQLIMHLINTPAEKKLFTNPDCKVPPPQRAFPLDFTLPAGMQAKAIWFLTPEYSLTQQALQGKKQNGKLRVIIPKLRFWSMVVLELESGDTL